MQSVVITKGKKTIIEHKPKKQEANKPHGEQKLEDKKPQGDKK